MSNIVVVERRPVAVVARRGIQGPQGPAGPAAGADLHFVHVQGPAASAWVITHGLGKYPTVRVVDSAGDECEGEIVYGSLNQLTITFSAPFSGTAYLN